MGQQQKDKKLVVVAQPRRARFSRQVARPAQEPLAEVEPPKQSRQAS